MAGMAHEGRHRGSNFNFEGGLPQTPKGNNRITFPYPERFCPQFIDGAFRFAPNAHVQDVISPYTGARIGSVAHASVAELQHAVMAAQRAASLWANTPISERCTLLARWGDLIRERYDLFAHVIASECGKTVIEARQELDKGLEVLDFAVGIRDMELGRSSEVSSGVTCTVNLRPKGVVAGIAPFNFPAMVPMWMWPNALALGNCFILKPSEKVPLTSSLMAALSVEAGIPPGVFSVVNGGREIAEAIATHPGVANFAFVGSTPVARTLYQLGTHHDKAPLCLGGAKNPLIVMPDADQTLTVRGVVDSFTACAGQRCMAGSLLIVVGEGEQFLGAIVEEARSRTLGEKMGAIISPDSNIRIRDAIALATEQGAKVLLDGRLCATPHGYEGGNWLGATILRAPSYDLSCVTSELFGPVLTVLSARTIKEAMEIANRTPYGNACSIFTTDEAAAGAMTNQSTAGMMGINVGVPVPREPYPFGGTKQSRFGQGKITGQESFPLWTDAFTVTHRAAPKTTSDWTS